MEYSSFISIPKRLLEIAEIKDEVYLAGQDRKIEIWDKEHYDAEAMNNTEFAELAEKLLVVDNQEFNKDEN